MRLETRVVYGNDVGGVLESSGNGEPVGAGLTSTQVQRLQTTVSEPRIKSRGNSANGVLEETETLVQIV